MKRSFQIRLNVIKNVALTFIIYSVSLFNTTHAQTTYQTSGPAKIQILGTSNIHDWEMKTEKGNSTAVFVTDAHGALSGLSALTFTLPVESLKSEHSGMDKNAYKAMRSDKFAQLSFTVLSGWLTTLGIGGFLGGFATLVMRMRTDDEEDDDPGRGAIV
jgi:hypothetical protein